MCDLYRFDSLQQRLGIRSKGNITFWARGKRTVFVRAIVFCVCYFSLIALERTVERQIDAATRAIRSRDGTFVGIGQIAQVKR